MDTTEYTSLAAQMESALNSKTGNIDEWQQKAKELMAKAESYIQDLEEENKILLEAQTNVEKLANEYADYFEHSPVCNVITDSNFRITQANTPFCETFNVDRQDVIGLTVPDLITDDSKNTFDGLKKKLKDSANVFYIQADMQVGQTKATMRIATQKSAEGYRMVMYDKSFFQKERDQLHRLLDISFTLLSYIDIKTHKVLYVSDNVQILLGISATQLINCTEEDIAKRLLPEHRSKFYNLNELIDEAEKNGFNGYDCSFSAYDKDQKAKAMFGHFAYVRNNEGVPIQIACEIYKDYNNSVISEQKTATIDSKKIKLLSVLCKEVYFSIDSISHFTDLLKKNMKRSSRGNQFIDTINICASKSKNLLASLATITRMELNQIVVLKNTLNVNTILAELYETYHDSAAKKGVELICDNLNGEAPLMIYSDYEKLNIAMSNLVDNAVKFTEKGRIEYGVKVEDKNLCFHVKDTGIGLSKNMQKDLFTKLPQFTDGFNDSSGLGLQITKGFIEMLGGKIDVESEENVGSTFSFTVPIEGNEANNEKQDYSSLNIVIAVSDFRTYKVLNSILIEKKATPQHISNGNDLMELVNTHTPDIIILDIDLPGKDGVGCLKEIHKKDLPCKVIVHASRIGDDDGAHFKSLGAYDYLPKPADSDTLLNMISTIVNDIKPYYHL